jgi:hypothetical protein
MKIHHLFKTSPLTKRLRSEIQTIESEMDSIGKGRVTDSLISRLNELRSRRSELESQAISSVAFDLSMTQMGADLELFSKRNS